MSLRSSEVVHRGAPALGLDHTQIDLQIVPDAHGGLGGALREDGFNERHRQEGLCCLFRVGRSRQNVDVVNNLFHAAKAAGVRHAVDVALEVLAQLCRNRRRSSQQVVPSSPAIHVDTFQNVIDRLLFETRNAKELAGFT